MNKQDLGKLLFISFPRGISEKHMALIRKIRPAGVLLQPSNMSSMSELQVNMERLHELIDEGMKLLISSDHEGGQLETIPGVAVSPGNRAIGSCGIDSLSAKYGVYLGRLLRDLGFNMLFAPVLDVHAENSNAVTGLRAYSQNAQEVSQFGISFLKNLQREGVLGTPKHFPGHGKATQDSHYEIPLINELDESDLLPFKEAVSSGARAIMTAHILCPTLDPDNVATLSRSILNDLLREDIGFDGLIISDAIEMKAVNDNFSPEQVVQRFFSASGDILLLGDADEMLQPYYDALITAYESGALSRALMEESLARTQRVQDRYVTSDYGARFLCEIAEKAIVSNLKDRVDAEQVVFVVPRGNPLSPSDTTDKDYPEYENVIFSLFETPRLVYYDVHSGELDSDPCHSDLIVSFVVDSFSFDKQLSMHKRLKDYADLVIYVILRDQRDIHHYSLENFVATNSTKAISVYYALKAIREHLNVCPR